MDAIDAARELLPLYARYGNAVTYPLLAAIGAAPILAIACYLTRPPPPADAHWTERAKEHIRGQVVLSLATALPMVADILLEAADAIDGD